MDDASIELKTKVTATLFVGGGQIKSKRKSEIHKKKRQSQLIKTELSPSPASCTERYFPAMRASLSGYRRLLKSATVLFRQDQFALINAKSELKSEFLKNKSITNAEELDILLRGIGEVDEMLRFNIVQGKLNENGNYGKPHRCPFIPLSFVV